MIDPARICLFIPGHLKKFKLDLFNRFGKAIEDKGGCVVRSEFEALDRLPDHVIPLVGCTPELRPLIDLWIERKRDWAYWDRGYYRRVFATWLPRGHDGGMYRFHLNSFQMQSIRSVPDDRFKRCVPGSKADWKKLEIAPWSRGGSHIVLAEPTKTYSRFHKIEDWTRKVTAELRKFTDRKIVTRDKESKRPLQKDIKGAHCLVAHGSNAAVEAAILGCPVFVDPSSAASLVGRTDISMIEAPVYPDRAQWMNSLAYSQFNERELVDGTLWRIMT